MNKLETLKKIELGERVAEDEAERLAQYFVETDQWQQMLSDEIDVVSGPKGSGKSALYTLLNKKEDDLFDKDILIASAENVRGATAFQSIITDPPTSERGFIHVWKLYCLTLIANTLRYFEIANDDSKAIVAALEKTGLLPKSFNLTSVFRGVAQYLTAWIQRDPKSIAYSLTIDPATGTATANRKTEFAEKTPDQSLAEIPVDELLASANKALAKEERTLWLLFDRLDVAFSDSPELERNALRALFRTYNDLKAFDRIGLKIFVRDDIWARIADGGFTEASHITKSVRISWTEESLLNLVVLRLLSSKEFVEALGIDVEAVRSDATKQRDLFYRLVPEQIDTGKNPHTFSWIVTRTTDGSGMAVPREIIHLIDLAKSFQIARLERGQPDPADDMLFDRSVFKDALPEVSKVRYEQTLLAEYPDMKPLLERLEGEKCEHTATTLAGLWKLSEEEAARHARKLADVGFFETRGSKDDPVYWVPFLYRGALNLVQGKA